MSDFINYIYSFISDLYNTIYALFSNSNNYDTFLDKQIVGGTLINIGLSWREMFLYLSVWLIAILVIVYFIKLIDKIIGLFKI